MHLGKYKINPDIISIICLVIIWKVLLFLVAVASFELIPLYSTHLLGGGIDFYLTKHYIFPWANFDGEHFMALAQFGYQEYTQAFFPLYPWIISLSNNIPGDRLVILAKTGLLLSSVSFLAALAFFYKLLRIDYTSRFSLGVIFLLLAFPTSFYFDALYSESLFLMLICAAFYFFRTKHYFWASMLGFLACTTRVFGVLIFISFLIDLFVYKIPFKKSFWIILIPLGLVSYMAYLYYSVGDPLAFYNLQLIVGEQHERGVVLFPQIIYRYVKILFNSDLTPLLTTVILELIAGILFFALPIVGYFKKIRLSYLFFAFFGYLLPTIQGSFSSLPRYVLVLFPSFIVLALMLKPLPKSIKILLGILSVFLLLIETAFFIRGYWVA